MSDESLITQLSVEELSRHQDKLRAWAKSLDTTPERLSDIILQGGESSRQVLQLLGIH